MKYSVNTEYLQTSTIYSNIDDLKKRVEELSLAEKGSLVLWFSPKEWSFEATTLYLDKPAPESIFPIPQDPTVLFQLLFGLYVANTTFGINPKDASKFIVTQKKTDTMTFALEAKGFVDIFKFETPYHVTLDYQNFETNADLNLSGVADTFKPLLNTSKDGKLLLVQLLQPSQDYGSGIPWGLNLALFHPFFKDYYKGEIPYKEIESKFDDMISFEDGHRPMWSRIERKVYLDNLEKSLQEIREEIETTFKDSSASKYPLKKFKPVVVKLLTLWDKTKKTLTYEDAVKSLKDAYTLFRKIYSEDFVDGLGFLYRFTLENNNALLKEEDFDPRPRSVFGAQTPARTRGYIGVFLSIIGLISGKFYQDMSKVATAMEISDFVFDDASYPSIETIHSDFLANFEEAKTSFDDAQKKEEKKRLAKEAKEEKKAREKERKEKEQKEEEERVAREKERKKKQQKEEEERLAKEEAEKKASEKERKEKKQKEEEERVAREKKQKEKEREEEEERVAREKEQKEEAKRKASEEERKEKVEKEKVDSDTEEEEEEKEQKKTSYADALKQGPKKVLPDKPPPKRENFAKNDEKVKDKRTLDEVVGIFKRIRDQFLRQKYTGGVTDSVVEAYAIEFHKFAEIVNANSDLKAKLRDMYNPDTTNALPAWVSIRGASYYPKETFVSSTKIIQDPDAKLLETVRKAGYGVDMMAGGKKWGSTLLHEQVTKHLFLIHGAILILAGFKMANPDEHRNLHAKLTGPNLGYLQTKGLENVFLTYFNDVFVLPPPYDTGEVALIRQTLEIIETNSRYFDQVKQEYDTNLIHSELISPLKKRFDQFKSNDFGSLNETLEQLGLLVGKEPIQLHQFVETKDAKTALQTKFFHAISLAEHVVDALENGQELDGEIIERLESEWPVEYFRKRPGQVINI